MMKRILALVLSFLLVLPCAVFSPVAESSTLTQEKLTEWSGEAQSSEELLLPLPEQLPESDGNLPDGLAYSITAGEVTITDYTGSATELVIPAVIEGYPVKVIGENSFADSKVTQVTIPEGVVRMENWSFFSCENLVAITLPTTLTQLGHNAFSGCESLVSIVIPEGVTLLSEQTFDGCFSLTSVTLPESLQSVDDSAFASCSSLKSIVIPDGVTSIGQLAFSGCKRLTDVTFPKGLVSIERSAFDQCSALTSVTLPEGLKKIDNHAFFFCSALTDVTLPESLDIVEGYAFFRCDALTDVYYNGTAEQWQEIAIGADNNSLIEAKLHCHVHRYDDYRDVDCNDCGKLRDLSVYDGAISVAPVKDWVIVGRPFEVIVRLNTLTEERVGSVDLNVILSENLQYVSYEIPVCREDFAFSGFDPSQLYFGCGVTDEGITGEYLLLSLTLVPVAEGEVTVGISFQSGGVGDLEGMEPLAYFSDGMREQAVIHTCSFVAEEAQACYLVSAATCTEAASYYKSCECGEHGEETFFYGDPLGHEHDDFWDEECNRCGEIRTRPLIGDANGDGLTNFADMQRIYRSLNGENKLEGDFPIIADVNKDGAVNFSDIQRIYQHLFSENRLF